jgi:hypothetical protein
MACIHDPASAARLTEHQRRFKVPAIDRQEDFMRSLHLCVLSIAAVTCSACSSTEWVHPNKPTSEYINDYNKCQNLVLRDPKLQQGSQLLILNATERCVQKEGWRLVEQ